MRRSWVPPRLPRLDLIGRGEQERGELLRRVRRDVLAVLGGPSCSRDRVYDTLNAEQRELVHSMIGEALITGSSDR